MAQQIARFDATFTALDIPSAMVIPVNAEEVALRVYRAQEPLTLSIFAVVDVPPPAGTAACDEDAHLRPYRTG